MVRTRALLVTLCLLAVFKSGDTSAASPENSNHNPSLKRFNPAINFYLGFNYGTLAELAKGRPEPTKADDGRQEFHPGLYGRAMMLVGAGTSTLWYSTQANIDFTRPGSVALWTSPRDWVRSENEDYFFPATIMSTGAKLMFGRQGRLQEGRTDWIYLWAKIGESKEVIVGGGDSLQWQNGQWHLWVMNWRSNSVEFSLDGKPPNLQEMPAPFGTTDTGDGHFIIGSQMMSNRYLLDEVLVFNRPLSEEEIKWMYDEGMAKAGRNSTAAK